MAENPDFKELLLSFLEHEVEYLIIGGYAVMKYSEPRYTKDLDLWVASSPENSAKVFRALAKFGAPLSHDGVTAETVVKNWPPMNADKRRYALLFIGVYRRSSAAMNSSAPTGHSLAH